MTFQNTGHGLEFGGSEFFSEYFDFSALLFTLYPSHQEPVTCKGHLKSPIHLSGANVLFFPSGKKKILSHAHKAEQQQPAILFCSVHKNIT